MTVRRTAVAAAVILATVALGATGCGTRFAYNHADDFLQRRIAGDLKTTGEQNRFLERHISALHDWHRAEELPRYAAFLRQARAWVADGLEPEEFDRIHEGIVGFVRSLARRALPSVGEFVAMLSDHQLDRWEAKAKDGFTEREEDLEEPADERLEERIEGRQEILEDWIDDLTDEQEAMLVRHVMATPDRAAKRLERDRKRLARLLELLRADRHDDAETELRSWFVDGPMGPDPEEKKRLRAFLVELDASLTDDQREHLLDEIDGWIEDFEALAP